jgi:ABC-2 type transport system permease protein
MRRAADAPSSTPPRVTQTAPARESSWERNGLRAGWSGLHEALQAEWTKLRTLPGTFWLLAAVVVTTVAVSAAATAAVTCPHGGCSVDPARTSLTGIYLGQAVAAILGVLAIGNEYSTGMIRATFTAMPRRTTVLAAKAAIIGGLALAAGAVAVAGSLLAGRVLLTGHGFTPAHGYPALALGDGAVLRAAVGSVLYLALIALLSLGVTTIIRDPAPAIGTVLGLLYLDPIIAAALPGGHWHNVIERYAPMTAGLAIQATTGLSSLPISPWAGLGVLAAWAAGVLLLGALLLRARDA